jgi:hypothetical protein
MRGNAGHRMWPTNAGMVRSCSHQWLLWPTNPGFQALPSRLQQTSQVLVLQGTLGTSQDDNMGISSESTLLFIPSRFSLSYQCPKSRLCANKSCSILGAGAMPPMTGGWFPLAARQHQSTTQPSITALNIQKWIHQPPNMPEQTHI